MCTPRPHVRVTRGSVSRMTIVLYYLRWKRKTHKIEGKSRVSVDRVLNLEKKGKTNKKCTNLPNKLTKNSMGIIYCTKIKLQFIFIFHLKSFRVESSLTRGHPNSCTSLLLMFVSSSQNCFMDVPSSCSGFTTCRRVSTCSSRSKNRTAQFSGFYLQISVYTMFIFYCCRFRSRSKCVFYSINQATPWNTRTTGAPNLDRS